MSPADQVRYDVLVRELQREREGADRARAELLAAREDAAALRRALGLHPGPAAAERPRSMDAA